jgi:ABC-2 type transport system ATP-binding protein
MTCRAWFLSAFLVAVAACERHPVAPHPVDAAPSFAKSEETGPPPSHGFGPDTREIGVHTGQDVPGQSRLVCNSGGRRFDGYLESDVDRTLLDARLELPSTTGPYPLVVLLHGWAGSKSGSDDIAGSLLAEGYAVLRYSARGFGDSWGRVNLSDIGVEIGDLRSTISRVVEQPACALKADAVAITGASYGGGQSWLAAVQPVFQQKSASPEITIRTIVPIVPWTDLLYSLVPNGRPRSSVEVPGALKFSYVNALFFSGQREPGEGPKPWYDNYPLYLREWHASLSTLEPTANPLYPQVRDGLAGYRSIWWQQGFWSTVAANRLPVFQVQGFTDDLFTFEEAKRMLLALKSVDPTYPIASYFGDIGHPRARNTPAEVDYVLGLVRSWLAYYLKGEGPVPANVVHAAITRHFGEPFDAGNVITVPTYEALATDVVTHTFKQPAILTNPASGAPSGPTSDPVLEAGIAAAGELKPMSEPRPVPNVIDPTIATYQVPITALTGGSPLLIAGQPSVVVRATTTSPRVQLNVRLYDVAPSGTKELITRGTYTTATALVDPLTDGVKVTIPTAGNLWRAPADHMLQLEISNNDFPYLSPSQLASVTQISRVDLVIPRR